MRLRSSQLPDVFGPCRGDAIRGMVEAGTAPSVCGFDAGRLIALDRNDRRMDTASLTFALLSANLKCEAAPAADQQIRTQRRGSLGFLADAEPSFAAYAQEIIDVAVGVSRCLVEILPSASLEGCGAPWPVVGCGGKVVRKLSERVLDDGRMLLRVGCEAVSDVADTAGQRRST